MTRLLLLKKVTEHISGYHSVFTEEQIKDMTPLRMLRYCHPDDRAGYAKEMDQKEMIREEQFKKFKRRD